MEGRIIENIAGRYLVKVKEKQYTCVARGKFKKQQVTPVVGDIVVIEVTSEQKLEGAIEEIKPRKNYSKRPKMSNLDQIVLVLSSQMPKPDLLLLDKQLLYASFLKIPVVIIINKIDLDEGKAYHEIKEIYEKLGYVVIGTAAKEKQGIKQVISCLKGKLSAFSGNSGVGKSTLLNGIYEQEMTKEGEVSIRNKKGKNTTTAITLYEIEEDTYIADTPGFSTFDADEIPSEEIDQHMVDFLPYRKECRYVGCSHIKEEECGIKKAVEEGKIDPLRYEHYIKIYLEQKEKEEHKW